MWKGGEIKSLKIRLYRQYLVGKNLLFLLLIKVNVREIPHHLF